MKHITELTENEVIHCKTEEEWDGILGIMGNPMGLSIAHYSIDKKNTVIFNDGTFDSLSYAQKKGYTIHPASLFLPQPISVTATIGEYTYIPHDGKLYILQGDKTIVLTHDIIDHIKQM